MAEKTVITHYAHGYPYTQSRRMKDLQRLFQVSNYLFYNYPAILYLLRANYLHNILCIML